MKELIDLLDRIANAEKSADKLTAINIAKLAIKKEFGKLQEQNRAIKEALEFYAVEDDWNFYCGCCATGYTKLEMDHGKLAREALAKVEE